MRSLLIAGMLTAALTGSAMAQMCGGGVQQQTTTAQSGGMSGMGCMGMMKQAQDDPMADKPTARPMMGGMMCPCCTNMASSGGMKQDAPQPEPKHDMPMPKQ